MKRFYYLLTLLLFVAMPAMLTSCDDPWHDDYYGDWYDNYNWYNKPYDKGDNDLVTMSQMLNGVWTGKLTNEYTNDEGHRQRTSMLVDFVFTQYSTNSCNGRGTESDYIPVYDKNGSPLLDDNGNQVYDTQIINFKWYVDPRTYNINIEYESGYRFVLDINGKTQYSGFSLGYNEFNGVMEGVNNDEYIFFDCQRVTSAHSPLKTPAMSSKLGASAQKMTFGASKGISRIDANAPMALRKH